MQRSERSGRRYVLSATQMDAQNTVSHDRHVNNRRVFQTQDVDGPRAHLSKPTKKVLAETHMDAQNTMFHDRDVKHRRVFHSQIV